MSKSMKGFGRAGLSALATSTLVIAACAAGAGAANADANFSFTRVDGHSRYDVSASVANKFGTASHVILASGEDGKFGDALAANYLAGVLNAPVLLTQLNTTPDVIKAALAKTGAKDITVVGGPLSVSDAQVQSLESDGYTVNRVWGHTRYDTDAAIIKQGATTGDTAIIATGEKFPDALSAGPLAFAKKLPVGLVQLGSAPQAVIDALKAQGVNKAIVLGGDLSVSPETRQQLENNGIHIINELKGGNRAQVATQVADLEIGTYGFKNDRVNVATGRQFGTGADALSAGPLTGQQNRPLLITAGDPKVGTTQAIGQDLLNWLQVHAKTLTGSDNLLFGGTLSISDAEKSAMEKAAQTVTSNQSYAVTGGQSQADVSNGAKTLQYTVSGVKPNEPVVVELFAPSDVKTGANGQTTFANSSNPGGTGNIAISHYQGGAAIQVVNGGVPQGGGLNFVDATSDANGNVTFSVTTDTTAGDSYVPVVFDNADNDEILNLGTDNAPTEAFGVGQETTTYSAAQAGSFGGGGGSTAPNAAVTAVGNNTFTTADGTYTYKSTDQFVDTTSGTNKTISYSQFVKELSTGDQIGGNYQPNGTSSFYLNDTSPAAPATVSAGQPTGTNAGKAGIQVSFPDSTTGTVASYNVYRATATQPQITGQTVTCPTIASGSFSKIGSVADVANQATYTYLDSTATPPATAGSMNPAYCYYVTSVDQTGEEGTPSSVSSATEASPAAPASSAPKLASASVTGTSATLAYQSTIDTASVDTDGSDYTVTYTLNGVSFADAVTAATPTNTAAQAGPPAVPAHGQVVLTLTNAVPTGAVVVVHVQNGTDKNTVSNGATPAQYEPTSDAVQTIAQ